jgi:acetylglutamate kinase
LLRVDTSLFNVNGDETAAGVAIALQAERLVFLTDVEGVLDANGNSDRARPTRGLSS